MSKIVPDRRSPASVTEFSDGNGGGVSVYTFSISRWKTWSGFLAAVVTIGVTVFGAARLGVRIEVREEIAAQLQQPRSALNLQIATVVSEVSQASSSGMERDISSLQRDVRSLEEGQAERRAQIQSMREDLAEMRIDVKELLRRTR